MNLTEFCHSIEAQPPLDAKQYGRRWYIVSEKILQLVESIPEEVTSLGTYLGQDGKPFTPTIALLSMLKVPKTRTSIINERGEWLFICHRKVLRQNMLQKAKDMPCIVQNERGEVLGLGKMAHTSLLPLMDLGSYLRDQ